MFTPTYAVNLKDKEPQIKLGLQGDSGTGKTYGALSFPNVHVVDIDGNLSRFAGKDGITSSPFHEAEFIDTIYEKGKFKSTKAFPDNIPARHSAVLHFTYNEARKFTPEQTLVYDSFSSLMDAFDTYYTKNPFLSKKDNEDGRAFWAEKISFATIFFSGIKALKCNVIITFHEHKQISELTGEITQKIAPLMQGGYRPHIKKHFTEFFRTVSITDKTTGLTRFKVQVKPDATFDAICRQSIDTGKEVFYDVSGPENSLYGFYQKALNK